MTSSTIQRRTRASKEIEIKIRKIERLQANLHHWRTKLTQNTRESAQRNEVLLLEKNSFVLFSTAQGANEHVPSSPDLPAC